MDTISEWVRALLGLGVGSMEIGVGQMMLRAIVVYAVTVAMVRLAKKRFMGRASAFDVILGIMLGSIVSRGVTGNAPFAPALAAAAALLAMHWLFSGIALQWSAFGRAVKGTADRLVTDGRIDEAALRREHVTEHDLWEDLRGKSVDRLDEVAEATLERNGGVSVIKAKSPPKVVEVGVADGVQTVRIEIGS